MSTEPVYQTHREHLLIFNDPEDTLNAVHALKDKGYTISDVVGPFPIHGIDEALGFKETRLGWATLIGGCTGFTIAMCLQLLTHAVDWPMNIGGKTFTAIPAIVPVTFELTVLFAAFGTFFGLLFLQRLHPGAGVTDDELSELRLNDDRFAVIVEEHSGEFIQASFEALCNSLEPVEFQISWRVS